MSAKIKQPETVPNEGLAEESAIDKLLTRLDDLYVRAFLFEVEASYYDFMPCLDKARPQIKEAEAYSDLVPGGLSRSL